MSAAVPPVSSSLPTLQMEGGGVSPHSPMPPHLSAPSVVLMDRQTPSASNHQQPLQSYPNGEEEDCMTHVASTDMTEEEEIAAIVQHLEQVTFGIEENPRATAPIADARSPRRNSLSTSETLRTSGATAATMASGAAMPASPVASTASPDMNRVPVYALPDEQYLELLVLPLLLRGLSEVSRIRPPDALAFLGAYLIHNNPQTENEADKGDDVARLLGIGETNMGRLPLLADVVQKAAEKFMPPAPPPPTDPSIAGEAADGTSALASATAAVPEKATQAASSASDKKKKKK